MNVKMYIIDGINFNKNNFSAPYVIEGKGKFGIELVLSKATELYYGNNAKIKVEDALKVRLLDDEIAHNFKVYLERKKL